MSPNTAEIIGRYMVETDVRPEKQATAYYTLRKLQAMPIGALDAAHMSMGDIIGHCRDRRKTVQPFTVKQDLGFLGSALNYAHDAWGMAEVSDQAIKEAWKTLRKLKYVGPGRKRDRRPTADEIAKLLAYFTEQDKRSVIQMAPIARFQIASCRRIGETCRLLWEDLDIENKTILVRDVKHPTKKEGNHKLMPLLNGSFDIIMAQPKTDARIFPYNPKSVGQRYTLAKKDLGIDGLHLHDSRREGASRLFEEGYSVPEVMLVTLHENPTILQTVYTKLKPADLHRGPASKR
jgi:integrase